MMTSTTSKRKRISGLSSMRSQARPPREMRFCFFRSTAATGRPKILTRARFYFDEYERVVIPADDVDLAAAASSEVTVENFVAVTPQESKRQLLAACAAA